MIEQTEFLTTAAQVAVGLAGFTGVASVFSSRPTAVPAAVQSERLRAMIETALVAVVFSLVPLLLDDAGFSATAVWRVSSVLNLMALLLQLSLCGLFFYRFLLGLRSEPGA